MKVLTLGNGFIGNHLPYERSEHKLDLSEKHIENILDLYRPDCIINAIGFCGVPNVDQCEVLRVKTATINTALPILLAGVCEKRSIHLIHIGSGCIFFGPSPNCMEISYLGKEVIDIGWKENDFANAKSYYSKTKYACDLALGQMKNVLTLRIRMPVSNQNNPRNFINKIRGYKQVIDAQNSMTFVDDLVRAVDWFVKNQKTGIYHVINPQTLSAARVMEEYQKYVPAHSFQKITENELDNITVAKRSNCVLNGQKLKDEGFVMTNSNEALINCMKQYVDNIK